MSITFSPRKTKQIRENGRSSDFTTPNFVMNCPMLCTYCFQHRHDESTDLKVATNVNEMLENILKHRSKLGAKQPNQCDPEYWTYDIGCNTDISKVAKHLSWQEIFTCAKENDLKFTFATKWFNEDFLSFNPERKVRIRLSLLPEKMILYMDKGTHNLDRRLLAMKKLYEAGYEIHVNFSPIIVYDKWLEDYRELFKRVQDLNIPDLKSECIFLTHEEKKHEYNAVHYPLAEKFLWTPYNQESKISQYGGKNIRYRFDQKEVFKSEFRQVYQEELSCPIRYIF